ncbi:MAG: LytTR family transcriptional regulator [Proteobacteria bacterium]|nr:LytTR family transcriptional regulator [Pseudomonadota bacterium]
MTNRKIDINKSYQIDLPSVKTLLISSFLGLVLGLLGPFGSYGMPLMQRLLYWVVLFNLGYFIYYITHQITGWLFNNKQTDRHLNQAIQFITPTLLASVPLSYLVAFATKLLIDTNTGLMLLAWEVLPQVLVLGLSIDFLMGLIYRDTPEIKQSNIGKPGHEFIKRLPKELGEDLICLVMEDHYMVVSTEKGEHMLLMRMKDALIELKNYPGMQVHRSSWIAVDKVKRVKKISRKTLLIMNNDIEISVSKKYLSVVKEAGLL